MGRIRRHSRRDTKGGKEGSTARKRGKSQTLSEAGLTTQGSVEGMGVSTVLAGPDHAGL